MTFGLKDIHQICAIKKQSDVLQIEEMLVDSRNEVKIALITATKF